VTVTVSLAGSEQTALSGMEMKRSNVELQYAALWNNVKHSSEPWPESVGVYDTV